MRLFLSSDAPTPDCETLSRMSLAELLYHALVERLNQTNQPLAA